VRTGRCTDGQRVLFALATGGAECRHAGLRRMQGSRFGVGIGFVHRRSFSVGRTLSRTCATRAHLTKATSVVSQLDVFAIEIVTGFCGFVAEFLQVEGAVRVVRTSGTSISPSAPGSSGAWGRSAAAEVATSSEAVTTFASIVLGSSSAPSPM